MEVLHVGNYHDALIVINDRFCVNPLFSPNPFNRIKEFLDKEKIAYEYSYELDENEACEADEFEE